jgi:hypothetical protein
MQLYKISFQPCLLIVISICILSVSCRKPFDNHILKKDPPGTIQISENLYFDKTEISNGNYQEYLYFQKMVLGKKSKEYMALLPASDVWYNLDAAYGILDSLYLTDAEFYDYPVVGLSYAQAIKFSEWRSDRVMEMYLVTNKVFKPCPSRHRDSVFTISRYFNGQYLGINPSHRIKTYPKYTLPDSATYALAARFADSLNTKNIRYCKEKQCGSYLLTGCNCLENKQNVSQDLPFGTKVILPTMCKSCRKPLITHLKGNVREMTAEEGKTYGCSYFDKCNGTYNAIRITKSKPNSYTGFRNICRFVKWEN